MFPKNARSGASLALAALLSLCCAAGLARAEGNETHINLDLTVEQGYDSNIFGREKDKIDSPVTIVRPSIGLENYGTLGHAVVTGWLSSHTFWNESELNGVDRGVALDVERTILPRISLFGNGSYQRTAPHSEIRGPDIVTIEDSSPGVPGQPVVTPGELVAGSVPNVDIAQGEIGGRYALSSRSRVSLSGGPFSIDYLERDQPFSQFRDQSGWFARISLNRTVSAIDELRVTLGANSSQLDDFTGSGGFFHSGESQSDQQNLTIGWDRSWNELWRTSLTVGVRRLESRTSDASRPITFVRATAAPPPNDIVAFPSLTPTDFDSLGPGLIGGFTIQRIMPRGGLALSYVRETRTTSSLAASDVNVDTVTLSYIHRLSARATLTLGTSFEHYASVDQSPSIIGATYVPGSFNPITGPEFVCPSGKLMVQGSGASKGGQCEIDNRQTFTSDFWYANARFDWQLRKRLFTYAVFRYEDRAGDDILFGNDYDRYSFGVGLTYAYDLGL